MFKLKNLNKQILAMLLAVAMLAGIVVPVTTVQVSAAAPTSYTSISSGSSAYVSITSSSSSKYFKFVPTKSGTYNFYSSNNSGDPYGCLLDASGNQLTYNDDGGSGNNFYITYYCTANSVYYVQAKMYGSGTGSYTLYVQADASSVIEEVEADIETTAGANVYSLFNSGRTGSGSYYSSSNNYNSATLTNGGYDIYSYAGSSTISRVRLGLAFEIKSAVTERAALTIYAYDIDDTSGERDYIYLVDSTAGTEEKLDGYLKGQDQEWNTTVMYIDPSYFTVGHTYYIKLHNAVSGWVSYVRTVSISLTTDGEAETPAEGPVITDHTFSATISASGVVNTTLYLKSSEEVTYYLEYAASYSGDQRGSALNKSITANENGTTLNVSFSLESGSPTGSYSIDVIVKDASGNPVATYSTSAGYSYSAVSYHSNGGSNNLPTDNNSYSNGNTVTVLFNYIPSRSGYIFLGWARSSTATAPEFTKDGVKSFVIGSSDVDLYAVWEEEVIDPSAPIIGSVSGAELEHGYTEGAISVSATAERLHTLSYQWYVNSVDSNVGGTAVSGATASSYSLPTGKLANTSEYYYCVVTATRTDNGLSASVTTDPVKVVYKDGEHSFKLVSSTDATCTSVGHKYYKCELCAKTKTETVPALGHTVGEWVVDSEASCTASGVKHTSCTVCGKLIENVYMPASGHSYVSVVTRKATCDQPGIITTTCSVCGDKSIKYVYTEHSYSVSEYVAPTCTVDGKYVYSCSECGHSYTETIPGSHDYEMKVTREATETETGLVTYTCSACGDSYTETTPIRATANVLLVQDRLPWSENSNTALLKKLVDDGYIAGWDIITSAALADTDISGYKLIYIANDQNNATYSNLNACGSKLTEYANAGGVIVYGACDMGWSGGSISYTLPGGVTTNNYYSNRNYIVNKDNPIVTGALTDGQALTDQILYGTYCSHTYFTALPEGAMIVLSDANGNPTLVVYPQNDGYIIATGLTWEYSYVRDLVSGGSFAKNVYDDLIVYALSLIDSCDHAYDAGTVVAPTCTEAGYVLHTCSVCGMSYRDGFTKATGHLNTEWTTVSDASATESGLKKKICKDCGETLATEIIAPIKSPSANVTSKSDSVVVNKDITFDIVISNADKVKGLKIVPVYDKNVLELLGMEWSVSADSSSVDCDGALAIAEWLSATDVNTAVLRLTFRALALSDGTSVSCTVTLSDESGTPDIAVVGKNISVITCPHTNVSYGKMNESYHSVVCSDCGYSTVAEHVYSSPTDATCDACGYLDTDVIVDKGNCGAGQKWSVNAGGTLTISGSGASWGYSSPSDIPWYSYADTIKNVVFEDGVTCIGSYAFYGCTGLTEITLPETLTEILDHAFEGCTGITVIIIPAKVTTIGASAFNGCTGLGSVTVPASVTNIGKNAFGGCTGLTGISFDRTLGWEANGKIVYATVIASETEALRLLTSKYAKAEWKCDTSVVANGSCGSSSDWKLTDSGVITVCGSGVTDNYSAGTQPWADRKADITAIVISDGVTYIGNCAFYECVNVKSITIPASVVVIGRYAFYSCKGVTEVVIPSTVVSIGVYAFRKTAVTSVTFESPNDWLIDRTVVSSDVLSDPALAASYLKKEHYTESWSKIGEDGIIASGSCGTGLTWKLDSSYVLTVSGNGKMAPYNSAQAPWYSYSSLITGIVIEEGVTSIGRAAFYGCENIVSVSLPSTVRSIGEYAFYYCIKLDSLTVPASVTEIGKYAFRRCSALSGVTLENAYGWSADEKRLYSYELGEANAATYLKNEYFNVDWTRDTELGADSEESGIIAGGICGSNVKWKLSESGVLTVYGKGAMYDYSAGDTPWASYADVITEVVIADGVTSVGARAFYRHTAITTVTLGKNVASIGLESFFYCTSLTDIVIPESVHSIGKYAFRKCNALDNAHLECADCWSVNGAYVSASGLADGATAAEYLSKVYYASEWTFVGGNCGKNAKWKLSESGVLTVYGKGAMYDYGSNGAPWASYRSSIVSIVVSEGVTSVGNCAFYGCACAVSVTLPSTLTEIGSYAFYGCSALEELNVPASVNVIGSYAFRKCNALATVTFGNAEGWLCDGVSAEISADALVSDYRSEWTRA